MAGEENENKIQNAMQWDSRIATVVVYGISYWVGSRTWTGNDVGCDCGGGDMKFYVERRGRTRLRKTYNSHELWFKNNDAYNERERGPVGAGDEIALH